MAAIEVVEPSEFRRRPGEKLLITGSKNASEEQVLAAFRKGVYLRLVDAFGPRLKPQDTPIISSRGSSGEVVLNISSCEAVDVKTSLTDHGTKAGLILARRVGEGFYVGIAEGVSSADALKAISAGITLVIVSAHGRCVRRGRSAFTARARIGIIADKDIMILREELVENALSEMNKAYL